VVGSRIDCSRPLWPLEHLTRSANRPRCGDPGTHRRAPAEAIPGASAVWPEGLPPPPTTHRSANRSGTRSGHHGYHRERTTKRTHASHDASVTTHDERAGHSGSQGSTKDTYREVLGPFSEVRRMNRYAPVCLAGTVRSQSFSLSQRFEPHSSLWLYFTPLPLIGFLLRQLPSRQLRLSAMLRHQVVGSIPDVPSPTRMQTLLDGYDPRTSRRSGVPADTSRKREADALPATVCSSAFALETRKLAIRCSACSKRANTCLKQPATQRTKRFTNTRNW